MHRYEATTERGRTEFSTTPARPRQAAEPASGRGWAVIITLGALGWWFLFSLVPSSGPPGLNASGLITMLVFGIAVACWIRGRLDDTFVALVAAATLTVLGALDAGELFATLGSETIWLLIAAFVLASGVNRTGLPARLAIALIARARSPRQLVHLITIGLVGTALAIPSTSGRAALLLPVYAALATAFTERGRLVRALAILFPTVVLLSAIASLVGAGAHLITSQTLAGITGSGISFGQWLLCGLPFAVLSAHVAAELVLLLFTRRSDRRRRISVDPGELRAQAEVPDRTRGAEQRAAALLLLVITLWSTESWHGLPPAIVALGGALVITSPRLGTIRLADAIADIPWSLLLFMAATTALGTALSTTGAAQWLAGHLLGAGGSAPMLLISVVVLSLAAHLVLQSRSARSSVLIPLVIPVAITAGMNPAALAFASTAAAGFCQTLPSSAKPVAMFARVRGVPTYTARDLVKLSALLGPVLAGLVLLFAVGVWPWLGLPLR